MTWLGWENKWMPVVEQQTLKAVSPLFLSHWHFHHSHFLCFCTASYTSVNMLLGCFLYVTFLTVSLAFLPPFSYYISLLITTSPALLTDACFWTLQLFCHHTIRDPVKATREESWISGCYLVPAHVYLDFGAKFQHDFFVGCQDILLCLSQSIHALL